MEMRSFGRATVCGEKMLAVDTVSISIAIIPTAGIVATVQAETSTTRLIEGRAQLLNLKQIY